MIDSGYMIKVSQLDIDILHWYVLKYGLVNRVGKPLTRSQITVNVLRDFVDDVAGPDLVSSMEPSDLVREFLERKALTTGIIKLNEEENRSNCEDGKNK